LGKSSPLEKILATRIREQGPRLTFVWGPRMVNPALVRGGLRRLWNCKFSHAEAVLARGTVRGGNVQRGNCHMLCSSRPRTSGQCD